LLYSLETGVRSLIFHNAYESPQRSNNSRIVEKNAPAWTQSVRGGRIESRVQITDKAIIDAIMARSPRTVLDIGCGEGWLARALAARGVGVTGVDVVPGLVEAAQRAGAAIFACCPMRKLPP
jgi:2-polyprenyl-3-methyl-5-hydroxy-6-metoxy-1,4-benzoquinol methylase